VPGQKDRISGPKGVTLLVEGRPLIDLVVERFAASGGFGRLLIAGPGRYYGERRGPAEVVDTDREFAANIRAGMEAARKYSPEAVCFTTCDLLPDVDEVQRVMEDYYRHAPLAFWFPAIRSPARTDLLGASAYKRRYQLRPEGSKVPEEVLPGHLVMVNPLAMRVELLQSSFELAYRTRTKTVARRFVIIIAGVLWRLLWHDLRAPLRLRLPLLTAEVFFNALPLALGLARGGIRQRTVETCLRRLFATRKWRRKNRGRRGRVPVLDALSLARDIDTRGEAEERSMEVRLR
ncbi:MAG: NTP transferase domain-containing protein, partial [Thermoanaerobaculia bacterium]|nr:NTP transferase domain-containing protein [Thermoanaerobaculia bacterium]